MNDKYEMWLIWKVSDLEQQIEEYKKDYMNTSTITLLTLTAQKNVYKECLDKYKEEKGE